MKARVKETGEIIDVEHIVHTFSDGRKVERYETEYEVYATSDLEFNVEEKSLPTNEPDYWEKLKHQYTGMILAATYSSPMFQNTSEEDLYKHAILMARELVNRLKEK